MSHHSQSYNTMSSVLIIVLIHTSALLILASVFEQWLLYENPLQHWSHQHNMYKSFKLKDRPLRWFCVIRTCFVLWLYLLVQYSVILGNVAHFTLDIELTFSHYLPQTTPNPTLKFNMVLIKDNRLLYRFPRGALWIFTAMIQFKLHFMNISPFSKLFPCSYLGYARSGPLWLHSDCY